MDYIQQIAIFQDANKFRFALSRVWDSALPKVMFIGLNPSTANAKTDDPTIRSVVRIAKNNGYGGVYMLNCFPMVSTDPSKLTTEKVELNNAYLVTFGAGIDVVFAWGNFPIVSESGRLEFLKKKFTHAFALGINKNGSPKHPLYCRSDTKLIHFKY